MAVDDGRTEVPDSEDEPMTSSPLAVSKFDIDKLSATACDPLQDRQDALSEAIGSHQAHGKAVANAASPSAKIVDVDQCDAYTNVDDLSANTRHETPPLKEAQASEAGTGSKTLQATSGTFASDISLSDTTDRSDRRAVDSTLQDPRIALAGSRPAIAGESSDVEHDLDGDSNENQEPASEMHEPANMAHIDSQSVQTEEPDGAKLVENDTIDELMDKHVPMETCKPTFTDPTAIGSIPHQWSGEALHGDDTLQTELAVGVSPHDITMVEKPASSGENCDQSAGDTNLQTGPISGPGQRVDTAKTDSISIPGADPTLQPGPEDYTDPASKKLEGWESSNSIHTTDSDDNSHDKHKNLHGLSGSVQSPCTLQSKDEVPGSPLIGEGKEAVAQELRNEGSPGISKTFTSTESRKDEIEQSPGSTTPNSLSLLTSHDTAGPSTRRPPIPKNAQEITLGELRDKKASLLASLVALPAIQVLIEENENAEAVVDDASDEPTEAEIMAAANKILKEHIKLLHEYNELKDVGQGLMGLIADQRGVRIVEVQEEFGIEADD